MNNINIKHDLSGQIFYAKVKGGTAELHYDKHGDDYLDFKSTSVPESSRNFGLASMIVQEGLDFVREQQLKVKPSCPFVQDYIAKHPEAKDLVVDFSVSE